MDRRRAAGNEAMPDHADPDAEAFAVVKDRPLLNSSAAQFHPNDFEASKAAVAVAVAVAKAGRK